jgi:hypothetical protein
MKHFGWIALFLCACTDHKASTNQPVLTGDKCEAYADATGCTGDPDCRWIPTGCPNDPSSPCPGGACESIHAGSGSGSGSAMTGCACPNGEVCYEQIGGPAETMPPAIDCTLPAPGTGDPCARIQGQGTCTESTAVSGLCLCDDGIR